MMFQQNKVVGYNSFAAPWRGVQLLKNQVDIMKIHRRKQHLHLVDTRSSIIQLSVYVGWHRISLYGSIVHLAPHHLGIHIGKQGIEPGAETHFQHIKFIIMLGLQHKVGLQVHMYSLFHSPMHGMIALVHRRKAYGVRPIFGNHKRIISVQKFTFHVLALL